MDYRIGDLICAYVSSNNDAIPYWFVIKSFTSDPNLFYCSLDGYDFNTVVEKRYISNHVRPRVTQPIRVDAGPKTL